MTEAPTRADTRALTRAANRIAETVRRPRSPRTVALWLALWLAVVGNLALWRDLDRLVGGSDRAVVFAGSFVVVLAALAALMLLTAWGRWMKPLWIAILVAAGVAQHFMLTYGVVMDTAMLANTMQTNSSEAADLLGARFVGDVLLVALPALALLIVPVRRTPWWQQVWRNAALFALALFRSLQQARSDPLVLVLGSDGGDGYWAVDDHVRDDAPFTRTARV